MLNLGKVLIIGDSYSTFENCVPDGNHVWYFLNNDNGRTDVIKEQETWWYQFFNETRSTLILNESFSGSTVCNTERPTIKGSYFSSNNSSNVTPKNRAISTTLSKSGSLLPFSQKLIV